MRWWVQALDLVLMVYDKTMFFSKSDGQNQFSYGGKLFSFPMLNATRI